MVLSQETEVQLSAILPRLYLGAERDVTQERLSSLGISYVISVSRVSPQPSFLPAARYLRIPIDDSLRDDLLPWIPQALRFIDAVLSSGGSVLVHCAAGISRSPALVVAYIMYSLGTDLDHSYRYVKERRPSISPNFNFLGQLQHLQASLSQQRSNGSLIIHPLTPPPTPQGVSPPPTPQGADDPSCFDSPPCFDQSMTDQADCLSGDDESSDITDKVEQTDSHSVQWGNPRPLTLSLSLKGQRSTNQKQKEVQTPCEAQAKQKPTQLQLPAGSAQLQIPAGSAQLQIPAGSASLLDKRKSLTLSLSPLGSCPLPSPTSSNRLAGSSATSKTVHKREMESRHERMSQRDRLPVGGTTSSQESQREWSPLSLTLNKLLGWGERMLLGGLLAPPVRMGQAILPYRC